MSLILDALNRADRERKNSQVTPDINTVHEVSYRPSSGSLPKLMIIGVAVLVVLLFLLVFMLWQGRNAAPSTSAPAPAPAPVSTPPRPSGDAPPSVNPETTQTNDAAMQPDQPVKQSEKQSEPHPEKPSQVAAGSSTEVDSLYQDANATKNPAGDKISDLYKPVEEPAVVESVPVQVPAVTSVSLLEQAASEQAASEKASPAQNNNPAIATDGKTYDSIHNVPDLRQLPWSVQQEIPSIIYSQHNFKPDGSSNVVLNGQPRRTGNQVGGQLNLDEIYVDGVLLRFREHRFKLRALNNWVNM
jgi:general secretion pathway protein B